MARLCLGFAAGMWLVASTVCAQESGSSSSRRPPLRPSLSGMRPSSAGVTPPAAKPETAAQQPAATAAKPAVHERAPAEPVPVVPAKEGGREHLRAVIRLKGELAPELAKRVNELLHAEGEAEGSTSSRYVVITSDVKSNSLLIGGPAEAVEEVMRLVDRLDQAPSMVAVDVVVAEMPLGEEKAGQADPKPKKKPAGKPPRAEEEPAGMKVLWRAQLTTLDEQPAFVLIGAYEPRITGVSMTSFGQTNTATMNNVGSQVMLTPRVGPDRVITMQITVEESYSGPLEEGVAISIPKDGQPIRSPNIQTMNLQSTLRIADGESVTLTAETRSGKPGVQRVVIVTPRLLPPAKAE